MFSHFFTRTKPKIFIGFDCITKVHLCFCLFFWWKETQQIPQPQELGEDVYEITSQDTVSGIVNS